MLSNKAIILFFAFLFCVCSCQTNTKEIKSVVSDSVTVNNSREIYKYQNIRECMPHDSIIKRKNTFVKYVLVDRGFDVSIGCNGWQKTLGYRFNCNVAAVYIPIYDWSSDQIIALQRGCGSGCRMSIYYLVNSDSVYERMNVLAYDEKRNLIAYYEYPDFIIENIVNCRKKNYFIKDTPACAISALCFNQTKFSGSHVNVNMIVQWKGSERTIRKTFQIPYGL